MLMGRMRRVHRWLGVGIFVLTLGVYVHTMAPSVDWWDTGERIACSYILGIPHPPGTPLYVLLGRVFTLFPLGEVAQRVNFVSALTSALAVWCVYWCTVALSRCALGGQSLQPFGDRRDVAVLAGGTMAALVLAFSYTQWFNATEAECYGFSIFLAALSLWLILYWEGTRHGVGNDRWLYLLAYLFGLGGGIHLLSLLTIPTMLLLIWFADPRLRRLIVVTLLWGTGAVVVVAAAGLGRVGYGAAGLGLAVALQYLWGRDRRACLLLGGAVLLFALGYSTYLSLFIRSGLDPAIDQNDPSTLDAFIRFINREQYGTDSMLLGMFTARASRAYQFWHLQAKYLFQQFPFPLLERTILFRQATGPQPDPVAISLLPYLLGLGGLLWHARHDRTRFIALTGLFVIMGFALSMYLNMPDPQPRERHYVFGGMYLAFALWIGLGWCGLVQAVGQKLNLRTAVLATVAATGLLLPAGTFARLYPIRNRTGNYIAHDYAHNLLQSCQPNSILFTNGDNDTFPLWYLQEVEGLRRDVRIVNLSLLNTNWYIKQLRDRQPKVDIRLTDTFIDSVLTDTRMSSLMRRYWPEPRTPDQFAQIGIDVKVATLPGHELLRVQDVMVIGIIAWNHADRPIHFAITVPASNRLGLDPYLRMEGMTMRLVRERNLGPDADRLAHNLFDVYRFRGVNDPAVHKDRNTRRLLSNYRACILQLAELYKEENRTEELIELMHWADRNAPMDWDGYYSSANLLEAAGQLDLAADFLEQAAWLLLAEYGQHEVATYENLLVLTGMLLDPPYSDPARAKPLYRAIMEHEPQHWRTYHELAAAQQMAGDIDAALETINGYLDRYGRQEQMLEARQVLHNARARRDSSPEDAALPELETLPDTVAP